MTEATPGARFRQALQQEKPLQVAGTINAYAAMLAERAGFHAIYLSGSGVATASYGLPDLGITSLENVVEDTRRITGATALPLLVDADTGWGGAFNIARTVKELTRAGAAGMHLEDQVAAKRCGHRPGKAIVPTGEMVDRIKAAVDARPDRSFVIMARTDAVASEGLDAGIERALRFQAAGADMLFPEALTELDQYRRFADAVSIPILANITEFGQTPLFTVEQLRSAGVSLALYPLSAFRAMSAAAGRVYAALRRDGTQQAVVGEMQTRADLYEALRYHDYERKLDQLFTKESAHGNDE
jgi:methylisocitrate lyase